MKHKPAMKTVERPEDHQTLPSPTNGTGGWQHFFMSKMQKVFGAKKAQIDINRDGTETSDMPRALTGSEVFEWASRNSIGLVTTKPAGTLIEQGQPARSVYVLLGEGGKAEYILDDNAYHLANLPAESIIGEISALTGERATATVTIGKPMKVLEISAEQFKHITHDPTLKERTDLLIQKRLMMSADFRNRLIQYLTEKESERKNERPNKEMEKELSLAEAIKDGLSEDHPIKHDFYLSYMVGNKLGTKKMDVVFIKLGGDQGYSATIKGDGVSFSMKFSEDGKTGRELSTGTPDGNGRKGGITTRIFRYFLQGVETIHSNIIEEDTLKFKRAKGRFIEDVSSSELAAHTAPAAARKEFISTLNESGKMTSYRVDSFLALILDVATDVERCIQEKNDKRLAAFYGISINEALEQLISMMDDYQQSKAYKALPFEIRLLCNRQADRIDKLPEEVQSIPDFHSAP